MLPPLSSLALLRPHTRIQFFLKKLFFPSSALVVGFVVCLLLVSLSSVSMAADHAVTNLDDSGAGSLRAALAAAADGDTITFAPALSGTIDLAFELPDFNSVTFINNSAINLQYSGSGDIRGVNLSSTKTLTNILGSSISSTSTDRESVGIRSMQSLTINGDSSGSISATSEGNGAFGIYSFRDLFISEDLSGTITSLAKFNGVAGIKTSGNLTVDGGFSGTIDVSGNGREIYGFESWGDLLVNNGLSGTISASGVELVAGLFGVNGSTINGGVSSTITATATLRDAAGFIIGGGPMTINGGYSGVIQATASDSVRGLWVHNEVTINDGLSGTISAKANHLYAYGIEARGNLTINNGLSGSVVASANDGMVSALYSRGAIAIDGGLSGRLSAIANSGAQAYAIWAANGLDDGAGGAVDVSGSILAQANGVAFGVLSSQAIKINVTGEISAVDTSGSGKAYAIAHGTAGAVDITTGGSDNVVTLADGANLKGHIELGTGANVLTMTGSGKVDGTINGGGTMTKSGSGNWATGTINATTLDVQDGSLQVTISQTAAPTIATTGTLKNDAQVTLLLDTLVPAGTTFTGVSSGGLSGTGVWSSPMLTQTVVGNDIQLTKVDYATLADSSHAGLAAALNNSLGSAGGDFTEVLTTLEGVTSASDFNTNLDELSGLNLAGLTFQVVDMTRFTSAATQQRTAEVRRYYALLEEDDSPNPDDPETWPMVAAVGDLSGLLHRAPEYRAEGVHLRLLGRRGSMDSYQGLTGYDYNSMVFSGGYDRVIDDNFLIGVSGGYSTSAASYNDTGSSNSTVDSYTLGLYSSWFKDNWYVDALMSGAYNRYDIDRKINFLGRTAESNPNGYTGAAKVAGGYRYAYGDYGLTPMVSLEFIRFHQDGYSEDGAGAANLTVDAVDSNFLETGLGGKVDRSWTTDWGYFIPEVSAMWKHEWLTQDRTLNATMSGVSFDDDSPEGSNDTLVLGTGFQTLFNQGHALAMRYSVEAEEHAFSQSLQLDLLFTY